MVDFGPLPSRLPEVEEAPPDRAAAAKTDAAHKPPTTAVRRSPEAEEADSSEPM